MPATGSTWWVAQRKIRGALVAIGAVGLGWTVAVSAIDFPVPVVGVALTVFSAALAYGLWLQLHAWNGLDAAASSALAIAVFVVVELLVMWGLTRRIDKDEKESARDQRTETSNNRIEALFNNMVRTQRSGNASYDALADMIGAAQCASIFNAGWSLFLFEDGHLVKRSQAIAGLRGLVSVDWAQVNIVGRTPRSLRLLLPEIVDNHHNRYKGEIVTADKGEGCEPQFFVGGDFEIGAVVLDHDAHHELAIVGARLNR